MTNLVFVDFEEIEEEGKPKRPKWIRLKLSDGSILRVRNEIVAVRRVEGQYDPLGFPAYHVQAQLVMVVESAPSNLMRKPKQEMIR